MAAQLAQALAPGNNAGVAQVIDEIGDATKDAFVEFLKKFTVERKTEEKDLTSDSVPSQRVYWDKVRSMKEQDRTTLSVDWAHVNEWSDQLADTISAEYYRVDPFLCVAVRTFVESVLPEFSTDEENVPRRFHVSFFNFDGMCGLRDLKTDRIGRLLSISGTVTRTTQVRPELIRGTFYCGDCRTRHDNITQQFKYTEPATCRNAMCQNRANWDLDRRESVFVDWQRVRVQENANEIPAGSMPRTVEVIVRHEMVERAKPGDKVQFTGTLIVIPDVRQMSRGPGAQHMRGRGAGNSGGDMLPGVSGLKALGVRDLTYRLSFLACTVVPSSQPQHVDSVDAPLSEDDADNVLKQFTQAERERIVEMKETPNLYHRMVRSVAPQVFGHQEVKRGILLMLFGGVHKTTKDGSSLRGDINVCVVGDPSTSKSQFLKYVVGFLPRAVYTSGKASSAAGLTASVVKDPETGEFTIEAGALMLADNSVCCIDEFDKMDPVDQTAIHEAMEQQTISISKAGIQATLNARTSILAAANPVHGRYDRSRNLKQNVDISAPIMSRFDVFYVVLDEGDEVVDYNIARHIVQMHQNQEVSSPEFSTEDLQTYIRFARTLEPQLSDEAKQALVKHYKELRRNDVSGTSQTAYRITVRQLESMIRLSEALARLHLEEEVTAHFVDEAARLLRMSIIHVDSQPINLEEDEQEEEEEEDVDMAAGDESKHDDDDDDDDEDPDDDMDHSSPAHTPSRASKAKKGSSKSPRLRGKEQRKAKAKTTADESQDTAQHQDDASPATPITPKQEKKKKKKKKLMITFSEYQTIARHLVGHLRSREAQGVDTTQSQLIDWYLELKVDSDDPDSQQFFTEVKKVTMVIRRLIKTDNVLIEVPPPIDASSKQLKQMTEQSRLLAVHPNYDPDNDASQPITRTASSAPRRQTANVPPLAELPETSS